MFDIDIVLPWVDGNDPAHKAKLAKWGGKSDALNLSDVGGSTRFASIGEIAWCIASINRNAPFVRKIFLVTDGQDPHLEPFLERNFPNGHIPVEIVDHKVIFRGYEQYLPVFNSNSIEAFIWRIPGLSEHFLLMNDDFLIVSPQTPQDFFLPDGTPYCYARKFSTLWGKLLRAMKPKKNGHKNISFKQSMMTAASIVGEGPFFLRLEHTPRPLLKSWYEKYFSEHPEVLITNIKDRFRDLCQYQAQELEYLPLYREGGCVLKAPFPALFYMMPKKGHDYIKKKMAQLKDNDKVVFCCFNSLDQASEEDQKLVMNWIYNRLNIVP